MKSYLFIILILSILALSSCGDGFSGFHTVNSFTDSSSLGKIYFAFVETEKFDTTGMRRFGKYILEKENTIDFKKKNLPVGVVIHFYNLQDTAQFDTKMQEIIKIKYPNLTNAESKLYYVKKAYIYSTFSRKLQGVNIPQDVIHTTDGVIPREGVDLKKIMKRQNTTGKDSLI